MKFNMHRAGDRPQWEDVPQRERNIFQRIGAATRGVVTPGNVVTVVGAIMGGKALVELGRGHNGKAVALLAGSLVMDAVDGWAAEKTSTKTPLGAALDPAKDKLLVGMALPVLAERGAISRRYAVSALTLNGVIAATALYERARGHHTEVSPIGKAKAVVESTYLVGALIEQVANEHGEETPRLHALNRIVGMYSLAATALAAASYVESALDH